MTLRPIHSLRVALAGALPLDSILEFALITAGQGSHQYRGSMLDRCRSPMQRGPRSFRGPLCGPVTEILRQPILFAPAVAGDRTAWRRECDLDSPDRSEFQEVRGLCATQ